VQVFHPLEGKSAPLLSDGIEMLGSFTFWRGNDSCLTSALSIFVRTVACKAIIFVSFNKTPTESILMMMESIAPDPRA
jgi:hypothetical protein